MKLRGDVSDYQRKVANAMQTYVLSRCREVGCGHRDDAARKDCHHFAAYDIF